MLVCVACTSPAGAFDAPDLRTLMLMPSTMEARSFDLGFGRLQSGGAGGDAAVTPEVTNRKRYIVPVVLSALVPGTGEMATGHFWRGLPLLALEIATWTAHAHYEEEGRNARDRYQSFADAHWRITGDVNGNGVIDAGTESDAWQENLEQYYGPSQPDPDLRWWDPTAPYECTCPYIPKEEDPQHYYENIGKYRYYWMAWDDWSYNDAVPRNSDSAARRAEYNSMRIESNDAFDTSRNMIVVAMANRMLSVAQSVYLVRRDGREQGSLSIQPMKVQGMGAGLELRLKY